jgi:hypothetical protein
LGSGHSGETDKDRRVTDRRVTDSVRRIHIERKDNRMKWRCCKQWVELIMCYSHH